MGEAPFERDLGNRFSVFLIDQVAMHLLQADRLDIGAWGGVEKAPEAELQAARAGAAIGGDVENR